MLIIFENNFYMSVNQRVEKVIKLLGLQKKACAEAMDINPASLSRILSGKTPVSQEFISVFVKKFNVNRNWLEYGTDNYTMFNEGSSAEARESITNYNNTTSMYTEKRIEQLEKEVEKMEKQISSLWNAVNFLSDSLPKKKVNAG